MSEKIVLSRIFEPETEEVKKDAEKYVMKNLMTYCLAKVLRGTCRSQREDYKRKLYFNKKA
jgi:hypothetical protein